MSFSKAKKEVIECLKSGRIQHEANRAGAIDEKNFLAVGKISVEETVKLISKTRGDQHTESRHHFASEITVHVFKPRVDGVSWYIKCYFIEPDVWFISVHK